MTQDNENPPPDDEWTSDEHTKLMSRYERIAAESAGQPSKDGQSVVAEFSLGGGVPRHEPTQRKFQSKDIYVRLENTIYGPVTQDELAEMLASGDLTGFESASADLQHWTPLIYHPQMTLSGEVDPDATHGMLHGRSTLPAASRASDKFDLEALADLDDDEPLLGMPLAAILIKPMKVSRKTGLPIPVHADLEKESIEDVRKRTDIQESGRLSGSQALVELACANESRLGDTDETPVITADRGAPARQTDSGWDLDDSGDHAPKASTAEIAGAATKPASDQMSAMVDAEIEALYAGIFDEPAKPSSAPEPVEWAAAGDSVSKDIEIDASAIEAMRVGEPEAPLPGDTDGKAPAARASALRDSSSQGNQLGAYMIGLLILAVGAVVVLALLTETTPTAPVPESPPASELAPPGGEEDDAEGSASTPVIEGNAGAVQTPPAVEVAPTNNTFQPGNEPVVPSEGSGPATP